VEMGRIIQTVDSVYVLELLQVLKSQECFTKIDYTELMMNLLLLTQKVVPVRFRTRLDQGATVHCTGIRKRRI